MTGQNLPLPIAKCRTLTIFVWKRWRLPCYCALLTLLFGELPTVGALPQGDNLFKPRPNPQPVPSSPTGRIKRYRKARTSLRLSPPPAPSAFSRPFLVDAINLIMVSVSVDGKTLYFSQYEVTQVQWEKVMGFNPSQVRDRNLPVTNISLQDITVFLSRLNGAEKDWRVTLPTADFKRAVLGGKGRFQP